MGAILFCPLNTFLLIAVLLYLTAAHPGFKVAGMVAGSLACLRLYWQFEKLESHLKFGHWLIGLRRTGNMLALTGMLLSQATAIREFPSLKIVVSNDPQDQRIWRIQFRNKGWGFIDSIYVSHENVLDLLAPGFMELDEAMRVRMVEGRDIKDVLPEIKTARLYPFIGRTVAVRSRIADFIPSPTNVVAFFCPSGEAVAGGYRIVAEVRVQQANQ